MSKVIGIVGTRSRDTQADLNLVRDTFFTIYEEGDSIVSGGCPKGGDRFAEVIARYQMIPIKIYYANWNLGRHAGFLRNTNIAKDCDVLIACVADNRKGGTEDTITKARDLGKEIIIVD